MREETGVLEGKHVSMFICFWLLEVLCDYFISDTLIFALFCMMAVVSMAEYVYAEFVSIWSFAVAG